MRAGAGEFATSNSWRQPSKPGSGAVGASLGCGCARMPWGSGLGVARCRRRLASLPVDPDIRFPGESSEYRRERNRLLEAEIHLRRAIERVAAQRRALPRGGTVPENYRFEEVADGGGVMLSQLF